MKLAQKIIEVITGNLVHGYKSIFVTCLTFVLLTIIDMSLKLVPFYLKLRVWFSCQIKSVIEFRLQFRNVIMIFCLKPLVTIGIAIIVNYKVPYGIFLYCTYTPILFFLHEHDVCFFLGVWGKCKFCQGI